MMTNDCFPLINFNICQIEFKYEKGRPKGVSEKAAKAEDLV